MTYPRNDPLRPPVEQPVPQRGITIEKLAEGQLSAAIEEAQPEAPATSHEILAHENDYAVQSTSGLQVVIGAGRSAIDHVVYPHGETVWTLTASTQNYVKITAAGAVFSSTVPFASGQIPLWQIDTDASGITAIIDKRALFARGGGGGGGGSPHAMLDGATQHTDSDPVAAAPLRGALIIGDAGPQWNRTALGANRQYLKSNGTDALWNDVDEIATSLSYTATVTTTTGGTVNNLAVWGNTARIIYQPGSAATINGTAAYLRDGQMVYVVNESLNLVTWKHQNASGTTQLETPGGVDYTQGPYETVLLIANLGGGSRVTVIPCGKSFGTTAQIADVAGTEATGSSELLPRADHVHKLGILTTKGDIVGYSTLPVRRAVGSNGQVLTADSAESDGIKWATPAAVGPSWVELPHNAQGADVVFIPAFTGASYTAVGIYMPVTPSAAHSFSFFKTGSGTRLNSDGVAVTTSGNYWTMSVSFSLTSVTDWIAVRHDTNAQDGSETSTSPHPDEGLKVYAGLIP